MGLGSLFQECCYFQGEVTTFGIYYRLLLGVCYFCGFVTIIGSLHGLGSCLLESRFSGPVRFEPSRVSL